MWMLQVTSQDGNRRAGPVGEEIQAGERHRTLLSLAGSLRHRGLGEEEILVSLLAVNRLRCRPPLPDEELVELARDVVRRYEPAHDPEQEELEREADRLFAGWEEDDGHRRTSARPGALAWDWLTAFATKPVVFLDRPFWQKSAFHLKVGRKGVGKGTSLADLSARFSRGELGEKRRVVWIGSEDSVSIDVKPRVLAAGGDPTQIAVVKDWLQLPRDVARLEVTVEAVGDVGLLVIDPVSNHIAGKNSNDETDVREAIAHLNAFADRFALVAIGVRHLTEKEAKSGLLAAILGSSAWVQVPRAVIALARDPQDAALVHMQVVAGNRMPPGTPGRRFRIKPVTVETDEGPSEVSCAFWEGESNVDVEELLTVRHAPEPSRSEDARADPRHVVRGAGAANGRRGVRRADRGGGRDQCEDGAEPAQRARGEGARLAEGDPCQGRVRGGSTLGRRPDRRRAGARSRTPRSRPHTRGGGIWSVEAKNGRFWVSRSRHPGIWGRVGIWVGIWSPRVGPHGLSDPSRCRALAGT
jgi:hypothetical protein